MIIWTCRWLPASPGVSLRTANSLATVVMQYGRRTRLAAQPRTSAGMPKSLALADRSQQIEWNMSELGRPWHRQGSVRIDRSDRHEER